MTRRLFLILPLLAIPILVLAAAVGEPRPADGFPADASGLTVHEWGTFTSVAGPLGAAVDWLPAGGPTDLPCFVNVSTSGVSKVSVPGERGGRTSRALVRMETPVIYFYSPREETVNLRVTFPHGLMTEWYPQATVTPLPVRDIQSLTGTIEWNNVRVMPGAEEVFPVEPGPSHYYAARNTAASPVQVGTQREKFLFYRGIASFMPQLLAQANADGAVTVTNSGSDVIPAVVLFENRGGKIGYRTSRDLAAAVTMERPRLSGTLASLAADLESILIEQGMYADEARAMVDTWKDTWFEQGTRVFYIVPPAAVNAILPLNMDPKPVSLARAFVGRMEVITPATQDEVRRAIHARDTTALGIYGRFLDPILNEFLSKGVTETERAWAADAMQSIRAGYIAEAAACTAKRPR